MILPKLWQSWHAGSHLIAALVPIMPVPMALTNLAMSGLWYGPSALGLSTRSAAGRAGSNVASGRKISAPVSVPSAPTPGCLAALP